MMTIIFFDPFLRDRWPEDKPERNSVRLLAILTLACLLIGRLEHQRHVKRHPHLTLSPY